MNLFSHTWETRLDGRVCSALILSKVFFFLIIWLQSYSRSFTSELLRKLLKLVPWTIRVADEIQTRFLTYGNQGKILCFARWSLIPSLPGSASFNAQQLPSCRVPELQVRCGQNLNSRFRPGESKWGSESVSWSNRSLWWTGKRVSLKTERKVVRLRLFMWFIALP